MKSVLPLLILLASTTVALASSPAYAQNCPYPSTDEPQAQLTGASTIVPLLKPYFPTFQFDLKSWGRGSTGDINSIGLSDGTMLDLYGNYDLRPVDVTDHEGNVIGCKAVLVSSDGQPLKITQVRNEKFQHELPLAQPIPLSQLTTMDIASYPFRR